MVVFLIGLFTGQALAQDFFWLGPYSARSTSGTLGPGGTIGNLPADHFSVGGLSYATGSAYTNELSLYVAAGLPIIYKLHPLQDGKPVSGTQAAYATYEQIDAWIDQVENTITTVVNSDLNDDVIAWYLCPEECRYWTMEIVLLQREHEAVQEYDPQQRPAFMYNPNHSDAWRLMQLSDYLDIWCMGAYPHGCGNDHQRIQVRHALSVMNYANLIWTNWGNPSKPIIPVLEMFEDTSHPYSVADAALIPEFVRHDAYAAIANGADGILIWSMGAREGFVHYNDYYNAWAQVATETYDLGLREVFFNGTVQNRATVAVTSGQATIPFNWSGWEANYPSISLREWDYNGATYLLIVNSSEGAVGFTIQNMNTDMGCAYQEVFEGVEYQATNGSLDLSLPARGVTILTSVAPEMDVRGHGISIVNGDDTPSTSDGTDLGEATVGDMNISMFVIYNTGTGTLNLTGSPTLQISGPHAADFYFYIYDIAIPPGASTEVNLVFTPSAAGLRTATIIIPNNDPDENPYTFAIQGTGIALSGGLVLGTINAPIDPMPLTSAINVSADFTDAYDYNDHAATIDWGDGNTKDATVDQTANTLSGSHSYAVAGVYALTVTVSDSRGDSESGIFEFVVVYDPNAGFVTGGGWIDSPAGAYIPDQNLTGKANFGFVSKYKKGQSTPSGNTEFQFKTGNLNFHSENYDWLVVAGAKAMYKGTGTINNSGNYGFQLNAIDAELTPSIPVDLFRIRIWDKNDNDALVYDNKVGETDPNADPTTQIGGGSIIIHKGTAKSLANEDEEVIAEERLPDNYALEQNYPNPFNPDTQIRFSIPESGAVTLQIFNSAGRLVRTLVSSNLTAGYHQVTWNATDDSGGRVASGVYIYLLRAGAFTAQHKLVLMK